MVKTIRGVYHNLQESEYEIESGSISLFFSSQFYMDTFLERYKEEREIFKKRINRTTQIYPFNRNFIADIETYISIEKRGFRLTYEGVEVSWLELHRLDFHKKIDLSIKDWQKTQRQK